MLLNYIISLATGCSKLILIFIDILLGKRTDRLCSIIVKVLFLASFYSNVLLRACCYVAVFAKTIILVIFKHLLFKIHVDVNKLF